VAVVLAGVVLALVISVILVLAGVPTTAQIAYAIGCLGTIITLQLDAIFRTVQGPQSGEQVSDAVATVVRQPTSLVFQQLIGVSSLAGPVDHPAFRELARRRLTECSTRISDFCRGEVLLPHRDIQVMADQVLRARKCVEATSYFPHDAEFWLSAAGHDYVQENARAAKRGVNIRRTMIYDFWGKDLERIALSQKNGGIEVLRVAVTDLPQPLRRNLVVFDRALLVEQKANVNGETIGYLYATDRSCVEDGLSALKTIAQRAKPV
jgi:hypothetical protein